MRVVYVMNYDALPEQGEPGVRYITSADGKTYVWNGSQYKEYNRIRTANNPTVYGGSKP